MTSIEELNQLTDNELIERAITLVKELNNITNVLATKSNIECNFGLLQRSQLGVKARITIVSATMQKKIYP